MVVELHSSLRCAYAGQNNQYMYMPGGIKISLAREHVR